MVHLENINGLNTNVFINLEKQGRHIENSQYYIEGRSILTTDPEMLMNLYAGKGIPIVVNGKQINKERFVHSDVIGIWKSLDGKLSLQTTKGVIHHSKKKGLHIVPAEPVDYKKRG